MEDKSVNSPRVNSLSEPRDRFLDRELDFLLHYQPEVKQEQLRVVIYDRDEISRAGLSAVVDRYPSFVVIAETGSRAETVEEIIDGEADVLLIGGDAARPLSPETVADIHRAAPAVGIVVITTQVHPSRAEALCRSGVQCLLLKSDDCATLADCIGAAGRGQSKISDLVANQMDAGSELTGRQQELLALLAIGYTNQEAAEKLFISPKTVESHRTHINRKLGISSRADLFAYARSHCLI